MCLSESRKNFLNNDYLPRWPTEESTAAADGLGGRERLAPTADESAAVLGATVGAAGSLEADAGVADAVPESGAEKPVVPKEPSTLPKASEGVVGHAVRPRSPWWCR